MNVARAFQRVTLKSCMGGIGLRDKAAPVAPFDYNTGQQEHIRTNRGEEEHVTLICASTLGRIVEWC